MAEVEAALEGNKADVCSLCGGGEGLKFEPLPLYCSNPPCSVRLRRGSTYYTTPDKSYVVGVRP